MPHHCNHCDYDEIDGSIYRFCAQCTENVLIALASHDADRRDAERWRYAQSIATYGTAPSFAHPKRSGSWCEILIPRQPNQDITAAIDAARRET